MTTDARRLMRLGPAARKERSSNSHTRVRSALGAVVASGKTVFPDQEKLLLGLSRMKENFQVRFLEGGGLVTARFHSAVEFANEQYAVAHDGAPDHWVLRRGVVTVFSGKRIAKGLRPRAAG